MKNILFYDTIIGRMGIAENGIAITDIFFEKDNKINDGLTKETELLKKTITQINEYFAGERKTFDVPIFMEGTVFQKKVWNALRDIPYGETRSYKQVAEAIGNPKACRAVGMANNKNPISILVPCHRVIGANGKLIGYGGGLDIKEKLINLEKVLVEV